MRDLLYKWRWWIWASSTCLWTVALLLPLPESNSWTVGKYAIDLRFLFAKGVHVSAYALLTAIAGWLCAPARYRALIIFGLMVHATSTEVLQRALVFLERTGELYDVALDNFGVAVGILLTWRWWTKADK